MTDTQTEVHRSYTPTKKDLYKAFAASLSGTSLEWYDFAIYSAASALVLGELFFPAEDRFVATIAAFSTYAVGYISRPVGGIIFGRLGDKIGRKKVLVYTLLLIGIATAIIGLLPSYNSIGITAPILLVLMRFLQGVGVGGEWGGAVLLSSEFGTPERRGFWASAAQFGPPLGNLLANGMLALLTTTMTSDQFLNYGWRIAFLASLLLVAFGLWIRLKLEDTPVFKALQETGNQSEQPITDVFRTHNRALISSILARIGPDVFYNLYTVFLLTYGVHALGFSRTTVLGAVLIGSFSQVFTIPLSGWLSDIINRRLLYAFGAIAAGIWAFVLFGLAGSGGFIGLAIGTVIAGTCHSLMYGPQAAFIVEQFHPRYRYTGASLAYTIAGVFGGALAPLMFTLVAGHDLNSWPVAAYAAGACVVTLIGLAMGTRVEVEEVEA